MTKQKSKKKAASRYLIPEWFTDRKKYNLAVMDITAVGELRRGTEAAIEGNRKRYERDASAYTRLMMEARILFADDDEVMRQLKKRAVEAPPNLIKMFNEMQTLWAKERQGNAGRFQHHEIEKIKTVIRREVKRRRLQPSAPPVPAPILALPEYAGRTRSDLRQQNLREARALASLTTARGAALVLPSGAPIIIQPTPGDPLVEIGTGQLMMFAGRSDLSGVQG
jgi:hypothetical protein